MKKRALPETRSFLKARKNKTYGYMGKKARHQLETRGMSLSLSQNCLAFLSPTSTVPSHDSRFLFPFILRCPFSPSPSRWSSIPRFFADFFKKSCWLFCSILQKKQNWRIVSLKGKVFAKWSGRANHFLWLSGCCAFSHCSTSPLPIIAIFRLHRAGLQAILHTIMKAFGRTIRIWFPIATFARKTHLQNRKN